jgi:hypothetical protein
MPVIKLKHTYYNEINVSCFQSACSNDSFIVLNDLDDYDGMNNIPDKLKDLTLYELHRDLYKNKITGECDYCHNSRPICTIYESSDTGRMFYCTECVTKWIGEVVGYVGCTKYCNAECCDKWAEIRNVNGDNFVYYEDICNAVRHIYLGKCNTVSDANYGYIDECDLCKQLGLRGWIDKAKTITINHASCSCFEHERKIQNCERCYEIVKYWRNSNNQ